LELLAVTLNVTLPFPDPLLAEVMEIHGDDVTDQPQPAGAVIAKDPAPFEDENVCPACDRL
jgi:hypothetical protein